MCEWYIAPFFDRGFYHIINIYLFYIYPIEDFIDRGFSSMRKRTWVISHVVVYCQIKQTACKSASNSPSNLFLPLCSNHGKKIFNWKYHTFGDRNRITPVEHGLCMHNRGGVNSYNCGDSLFRLTLEHCCDSCWNYPELAVLLNRVRRRRISGFPHPPTPEKETAG